MEPLDCVTCWRTGPKFTIYFSIALALISIITCILDLAMFGGIGYSASYLGLNLQRTFQHIELWRLISTHLICNSIWMTLFFLLIIFWNSSDLEQRFGFKKYIILLLTTVLLSTALACVLGAFFGLIPGINYWSYFAGFWDDNAAVGPTHICILLAIYEWRVNGQSDTMCCCCFKMKRWVICLIDIIWCELSMYYPWNGVWYNIAPVIVGWSVPMRFLKQKESQQDGFTTGTAAVVQPGEQHQFQTLNEEAPRNEQWESGKNASPAREQEADHAANKFSGKGRTL